jgi:hypothetical protein
MSQEDRSQGRGSSVVFAAGIGALSGAALASARDRRTQAVAALTGGLAMAASDAVARAVQRPNEIPPLWSRIAASTHWLPRWGGCWNG